MKRYKLLVFSDPALGRDKEYNEWYSDQHLQDLCALTGFTSAQRFKLLNVTQGTTLNGYLAIYDIETDDIQWVIENMMSKKDTPAMEISPSLNLATLSLMVYEEITPVVTRNE
jgi:hypothetical protein